MIDFGLINDFGKSLGALPIAHRMVAPELVADRSQTSASSDIFSVGAGVYAAVKKKKLQYGEENPIKIDEKSTPEEIKRANEQRGQAAKKFREEKREVAAKSDPIKEGPLPEGQDAPLTTDNKWALSDSKHEARTAYTDFVNKLMHPDLAQRPSPQQAREHPFLADPLLDKEQRGLLRS